MAVPTPWAILLCKFLDKPYEPKPKSFFQELCCKQGKGMGGLLDYLQEISYGAVDLSASNVYGWFSLNHTFAEDKTLDRFPRIMKGIQAAQANGVDLSSYFGIVVIHNEPAIDVGSVGRVQLDLGGGAKAYGLVVTHPLSWNVSVLAQEVVHGYGLIKHARSAPPFAPETEYGDPYDVMGSGLYSFYSQEFDRAGPGMNAAYLLQLGWLPQNRVVTVVPKSYEQAVELAPLENPEIPGALAARIDAVAGGTSAYSYLVEFRRKAAWDHGIPSDSILVHEVRPDGYSYLTAALAAEDEQFMNSQFGFGVVVDEIDAAKEKAKIRVGRNPTVRLEGKLETVSSEYVKKGTYHFPGSNFCKADDYAYVRELRHQWAQYVAHADLFDPPASTFEWYLNDTPLDQGWTDVVLSVTSRSALPPPSGKLTYGHDAVIKCVVTYSSIDMQNRPEDGTYSVDVRVVASNASGQTAMAEETFEFEGDVLVFEREYYEDMRRCLANQRATMQKKKTKPKKRPKGGDPGPIKTAKRRLAQAVHEIVQEDPRLIREMERRFGDIADFRRGLPPARRQPAQSKKSKQRQHKRLGARG
jgi:hypothetical protein